MEKNKIVPTDSDSTGNLLLMIKISYGSLADSEVKLGKMSLFFRTMVCPHCCTWLWTVLLTVWTTDLVVYNNRLPS